MTDASAPVGAPDAFFPHPSGAMSLLGGGLVAFYILFPLDRGFPTVPVFGRPLNSAVVATLAVLWALVVQSHGKVLEHLREPYCVIQSAYFGILVLSSLRLTNPLVALHSSLVYYCTFVLNYVILRYITRRRGTHLFARIVAVVCAAAAVVGVIQGVFRTNLPMYEAWFRNYYVAPGTDYSVASARVDGTLSNPLLYGVAMALSFPYVLNQRLALSRVLVGSMLLLAIGLSGSRTPLLVLLVLGFGAVAAKRSRALWALVPPSVGAILFVLLLAPWSMADSESPFFMFMERLGVREGPAATSAAQTITSRRDALREGIREVANEWDGLTWAIGRGRFTSASVGERVDERYNTVDNLFLGILYEQGLVGLTVFMAAFGVFLRRTSHVRGLTLHWYQPLGLLAAGMSFNWDAYSTFNILAVGSMAITATHAERYGSGPPTALASGGARARRRYGPLISKRAMRQDRAPIAPKLVR